MANRNPDGRHEMSALRERPVIREGGATWTNCSLTWWERLNWKLEIGWKHEFTNRQTRILDDGRTQVTEFQCWHNKKIGKTRCVPVTYFAPPCQWEPRKDER